MRPAAIILLLAFLTAPAFPATIIVPDHYPTIQAAIDAAAAGDNLFVRPGTYVENIDFKGKAITLVSLQGPGLTVIDGGTPANPDFGSVVTFANGEGPDSVLMGFTVTNGAGTRDYYGSGLFKTYGGGIYCSNASPTIRDNIITLNQTDKGAGLFCIDGSRPVITSNVFSNNDADLTGGGMCSEIGGASSEPTVTDNTFTDNTAYYGGGGIYCWGAMGAEFVIGRNTIRNNTAWEGGGIYCFTDDINTIKIHDNSVVGNRVVRYGAKGGGISAYNVAEVTGNLVSGNTAVYRGGGIDSVSVGGSHLIANNVVFLNQAANGGGIATGGWGSTHVNNTVTANTADHGGGIYCGPGFNHVVNTISWGNQALIDGQELYLAGGPCGSGCTLRIEHTNVAGGLNGLAASSPQYVNLDVGSGNIDADPLFADPAADDFHLTFGSPCVGAGGNAFVPAALDKDREGDPRIAGKTVDMGADEFHFRLYRIGAVVPGAPLEIKAVGLPGMPVRIGAGTGLFTPPKATPYGTLWLKPAGATIWSPGAVPGNGVLAIPAVTPGTWIPGDRHYLQALVGPMGGPFTTLTNLLVLEVE